jgi:hypothetical protein
MGRGLRLVAVLLLAGAAAAIAAVAQFSKEDAPQPPRTVAVSRPPAPPSSRPARNDAVPRTPAELVPVVAPKPQIDPDDERRAKLVGLWKQNYTGTRWLRIRPDGTATMFIDPDWTAKLVIGDHLTMQIEWVVKDGRALFKSVSGEPESAFKAVNTLFGRDRNRPITELTDERFVLRDEEDGSKSEWTRVGPEEKTPAAVAE